LLDAAARKSYENTIDAHDLALSTSSEELMDLVDEMSALKGNIPTTSNFSTAALQYTISAAAAKKRRGSGGVGGGVVEENDVAMPPPAAPAAAGTQDAANSTYSTADIPVALRSHGKVTRSSFTMPGSAVLSSAVGGVGGVAGAGSVTSSMVSAAAMGTSFSSSSSSAAASAAAAAKGEFAGARDVWLSVQRYRQVVRDCQEAMCVLISEHMDLELHQQILNNKMYSVFLMVAQVKHDKMMTYFIFIFSIGTLAWKNFFLDLFAPF
jgi:hypothetical protein